MMKRFLLVQQRKSSGEPNETKAKLPPLAPLLAPTTAPPTPCLPIHPTFTPPRSPPKPHSDFIRRQTVLVTLYIWSVLISVVIMAPVGASIDCFKCVSHNGNNPSCEDPFHNNYSASILESPCMGGRKGRNGLFPATACIKLIGTYYDNGETVVVRGCSLDSNTLTTDTEIIRMSHCGGFELDDRYVKGCLQSCDDSDGCNGSTRPNFSKSTLLLIALIHFTVFFTSSQFFHL